MLNAIDLASMAFDLCLGGCFGMALRSAIALDRTGTVISAAGAIVLALVGVLV